VPNPSDKVDFIIHGPPGSAPPVLADAILKGIAETKADDRLWRTIPKGDDPGVDAMNLLVTRPGDADCLSTCTPVFLQAPLLRGMSLTHRQLTPLARVVADSFFLVVRADSPWTSAENFLKGIGERTTRTGGYFKGGINHLLGLAIADGAKADVEFIVVPSEPAVWTAMIEGRIDWGCGVAAEILPHVEAGTLRVLAVLNAARSAAFPDIPTLGEAGAAVTFALWRGLMGPPDLSVSDQSRWHEIIDTMRGSDAWGDYLARNGQQDAFLPGQAFSDFLEEEWAWYEKHLGMAGLLPA
jgi:putative tricarboxylic transport membrane protein